MKAHIKTALSQDGMDNTITSGVTCLVQARSTRNHAKELSYARARTQLQQLQLPCAHPPGFGCPTFCRSLCPTKRYPMASVLMCNRAKISMRGLVCSP